MTDQPSLFDDPEPVAHARRSDPGTSHEAAASVDEISRKQAAVLRILSEGPLTDAALVSVYEARSAMEPTVYPPQSTSGIRTRRSEVTQKQRVRDSGARVRLTTGRHAIVWEIVP
jgi:hypothetical protein